MINLKDNKNIVFGIVLSLLVVFFIIYFVIANKGIKAFEDFLYDNDLTEQIQYREIDYSPLSDTISMEDIDLELIIFEMGKRQVKITGQLESLSIEGVSQDEKRNISFTGYLLSTVPSPSERKENILYELLKDPLETAQRMGVEETNLDGKFAYDYDDDDQSLEIEIAMNAEEIAGYQVLIKLERARKLFKTKLSDFAMTALINAKKHLDEFGKVELDFLNANLNDHGFIEHLAQVFALSKFSYKMALNNNTAIDAMEQAKLMDKKEKAEMAKYLDEDSIENMILFATKGGDLNIAINTNKPVRLSNVIKNDKLHRDIEIEIER